MKVRNLLFLSHVWVDDSDKDNLDFLGARFVTYDLGNPEKPYICKNSAGTVYKNFADVKPPGGQEDITYLDILPWDPIVYSRGEYRIMYSNGCMPNYDVDPRYIGEDIYLMPWKCGPEGADDEHIFDLMTGNSRTNGLSLLLFKKL